MRDGTGLKNFASKFPNRYFDVGIAEQHAITFAAGLAKEGMIPIVPIYSSFYQRAYDQVIHDVCMQNLPVIMCADRAGIVGNDGETHQGLYDMSFFNIVPNLTVMAPKDFEELGQMLEYAVTLKKPVVIRYPRGGEENFVFTKHTNIKQGKAEFLKDGNDAVIISIGKFVAESMEISKKLEIEKINVGVVNARFLKPFDDYEISKMIDNTKLVITIEDGTTIGGLGAKIKELVTEKEMKEVFVKCFAYPDKFIEHGSPKELEERYGMNLDNIANFIKFKVNEIKKEEKNKIENNNNHNLENSEIKNELIS